MDTVLCMKDHILPVNSHGYYKFQMWQLTAILISKLHVKFIIFLGDYPSAATVCGVAINW